jgi:hypothetical protein
MKFVDLLNEIILEEPPEWDIDKIAEALSSNFPENDLYEIVGSNFFPKIQRWLRAKLENIEPYSEWKKKKESELQAKIKTYLGSGKVSTERKKSNARILAREIINSYDEWEEYDVKPADLPKDRFA